MCVVEIFAEETVSLQLFKNQEKGWSVSVSSENTWTDLFFYQVIVSLFFMSGLSPAQYQAIAFMKTKGKEIREFQGYIQVCRLILSCEKHQGVNGLN